MAIIIDGKYVSQKIRENLKEEVLSLKEKGITPGLAVIIVGNNPSSEIYVRNKAKACEAVGINSSVIKFDSDIDEDTLIDKINELNIDKNIHGILVQLPLPKHIDEKRVIKSISPSKDVDCFTEENVGKISIGDYGPLPCTPAGIIELLNEYNVDVVGKNCCVIGRSNIVGKPMAMLLINAGATVTVCNSKTKDLKEITKNSDIVICAIGKPRYITSEYIKDQSVVIDVGINRLEDGKICGDIDFDNVVDKCSYITPVPGGVGPMTITSLLKNTIYTCKTINNL